MYANENALHRTVACSEHQFQGNGEVRQPVSQTDPHSSHISATQTTSVISDAGQFFTFNQPGFPDTSLDLRKRLYKNSYQYHP